MGRGEGCGSARRPTLRECGFMMSEVPTGSAPLASEDGEPGSPSLELYSRPAAKKKIMLFSNPLDGLRKKVSKDRNRYTDGTYDLDLTYITENVIAMGFPASGIESAWRNHIGEVSDM